MKWISSKDCEVLQQPANDALIWIRCAEAGKHLKPAGQRPSRTDFGHPCSRWSLWGIYLLLNHSFAWNFLHRVLHYGSHTSCVLFLLLEDSTRGHTRWLRPGKTCLLHHPSPIFLSGRIFPTWFWSLSASELVDLLYKLLLKTSRHFYSCQPHIWLIYRITDTLQLAN